MTDSWLVMRLQAPLMAFGGVAVDQVRPVRDFPAASMMAGLIGNALGWQWSEGDRHQALQDRLVFAACQVRDGSILTDMQNAELSKHDKGWTTRGSPEGREGASYGGPHRRTRDYHADASVLVVLSLRPPDEFPTLAVLAEALDCPARPLFIGRKPCLPSGPFLAPESNRWVRSLNAYAALCAALPEESHKRAIWPAGEGPEDGKNVGRLVERHDLRNWRTGLHSGSRQVVEGWTT